MKASWRYDLDTSLGANYTSQPYTVEFLNGYSVCAAWTGTAVRTLKLQASNNAYDGNVNVVPGGNTNPGATWVDITGSSISVSSGSGGQFWNVADVYYQSFRIVWERASGSGTMNAFIRAKGIQ